MRCMNKYIAVSCSPKDHESTNMTAKTSERKQRDDRADDLRLAALVSYYGDLDGQLSSKRARLYEACIKVIEKGYWNPGDRLPTEAYLADCLPVGLGTIQAVFQQLASDGLIVRERRKGSHVARQSQIERDILNFNFLDDDGASPLPILDEVLTIEETTALGPWSEFLGPQPSYIKIHRLSSIGGELRIWSDFYLGDPKFRPFVYMSPESLMNLSLRSVLHDRFGMPALHSDWLLSFHDLTQEQSEALQVAGDTHSLSYEIREYTIRSAPLFLMKVVVPKNARTLRIRPGR